MYLLNVDSSYFVLLPGSSLVLYSIITDSNKELAQLQHMYQSLPNLCRKVQHGDCCKTGGSLKSQARKPFATISEKLQASGSYRERLTASANAKQCLALIGSDARDSWMHTRA